MSTRNPLSRSLLALGLVAALSSASVISLAGCTPKSSSQSTVITNPPPIGLTPAQRGVIRREALTAAEEGFDTWRSGDIKAMKGYYTPFYVNYYKKLYAQYAKENKKRVRKMDIKSMDVVDMNNTGRQVIVNVGLTDRQYYTDLKGKAITKPTNKFTYVQLTLSKKDGKWIIENMIGNATAMK